MLRHHLSLFALLAAPFGARAMDSAEWKSRQSLAIDHVGVVKLALPPSTLDAARVGLADLRLLGPDGRETPFLIEYSVATSPVGVLRPKAFNTTLAGDETQLIIDTGTAMPLDSVTLSTPAPYFLKAARVEVTGDGEHWETLKSGAPLFRQFGAEQMRFELGRHVAASVRITVDDLRTRPVPFTGAMLTLAVSAKPAPVVPLQGARIVRREEFNGESVLTLNLGAQHLPLANVRFATSEPIFARPVYVSVRELRDGTPDERAIARGSIYRVSAEGLPPSEKLELPINAIVPAREILVHIANGDSPPLAVDDVRVEEHPIWLIFRAGEAGAYTLLTGNPDVAFPSYDLSSLAAVLKEAQSSALEAGALETNPGYRRHDTLADTPILGAELDTSPWRYRKTVRIAAGGVQQLELDPDVLGRVHDNFADLRIILDGSQVPYLVERTALFRSTDLPFTPADDPARPRVSRWQVKLPNAGLPIQRLTVSSTSALFQRHVLLIEKRTDDRAGTYDQLLGEGEWSKTPGNDHPLVLHLSLKPSSGTLYLETDNGDNPPIVPSRLEAAYPVARLLFKADAGPLALYYGNREAAPPRYDLALVAPQILMADRSDATLAPEEDLKSSGWSVGNFNVGHAGILFWCTLALVVVVLLIVVAKLLPKPPGAPSS